MCGTGVLRGGVAGGQQVAVGLQRLLQLLDARGQQRGAARARLATHRHCQLLLVAVQLLSVGPNKMNDKTNQKFKLNFCCLAFKEFKRYHFGSYVC